MSYTGKITVKNGIYQAVINYKENGKYKQKWVSTGLEEKGNKRRAEAFLKEVIDKFAESRKYNGEIMIISQLLDNWMTVKKSTVRGNTYNTYNDVIEYHIRPYFDNLGLSIQELEAKHYQAYFTYKSETLLATSLDKHYTVLHSSIEYAINTLELLRDNKLKRIVLPKKTKRVPKFYAEQEIRKLFECVKGESIETPVMLSATYGLRRSEVLGLMWSSVDFSLGTLTVGHTAVRCGSDVIYDDVVKADSSFRTLPLTKDIKAYLLEIKEEQKKNKKLFGNTYHESDYICTWEDGRPIAPDYVTSRFGRFLKEKELPHIRFHDLRHSSASLPINMGFTLKEVQEWLGHADIASTNIYSHLLYKSKENMAKRVEEALRM